MVDPRILQTELFAWIGEDELGSGEIGIRAAVCPAGFVPMVAILRHKIDRAEVTEQLEMLAKTYNKPRYLVRFTGVEIVKEIEP